jgi:hypothetical protein
LLIEIYLNNNQISAIDLPKPNQIYALRLENNLLSTIDLTGLNNLGVLYLDHNQLSSIDLTGLNLSELGISYNNLTTL